MTIKATLSSSLFIIIYAVFITHVHVYHAVYHNYPCKKNISKRSNNSSQNICARFRLAIISPRGLRFISEFYDTEFCDDIETRTSTAVAAIFRVCFVAASSETYVNQKKKSEKEKYDFPCTRFFFFIFYCGTKSARKFNSAGDLTAVSHVVNFDYRQLFSLFHFSLMFRK